MVRHSDAAWLSLPKPQLRMLWKLCRLLLVVAGAVVAFLLRWALAPELKGTIRDCKFEVSGGSPVLLLKMCSRLPSQAPIKLADLSCNLLTAASGCRKTHFQFLNLTPVAPSLRQKSSSGLRTSFWLVPSPGLA